MKQAMVFYDRALLLDPRNIEAMLGAARVHMSSGASFMTDDRPARFAAAETTLIKVLSIAPQNAVAHMLLGSVYVLTKRTVQGIAECGRR